MLNMINVVPEIMHLDNLNVAKQSWTKGAVQLMSEHMKSWASNTFKAMGTKLDVRLCAEMCAYQVQRQGGHGVVQGIGVGGVGQRE